MNLYNCNVHIHMNSKSESDVEAVSTEPIRNESSNNVSSADKDYFISSISPEPITSTQTPVKQSYPEIDLEHPITDIIRINKYNEQPSIDLIGEFRWKMKLLLMDKICSQDIKQKIGRERAKSETKNKKRQSNEGDVDESMDADLQTEADIQEFIYYQASLYISTEYQDIGVEGLGGKGANVARKGALGDQYFTTPAMYELLYGLIPKDKNIYEPFFSEMVIPVLHYEE